jgi:SAM-dependent methyltransferase
MIRKVKRVFRSLVEGRDAAIYSKEFYENQQASSRRSAERIVPILLEAVVPARVVDVGCGVGTWAAEFLGRGVEVSALDGDHVRREDLHIPPDLFRPTDLNNPPAASSIGSFDLAICLEVAEHLAPGSAEGLVDFLTELAPDVFFSAAVPGQGGRGHIHERPQSYWTSLFAQRGFSCLDIVRPVVWDSPAVCPWYAQNAFLYSRHRKPVGTMPIDVVHPAIFRSKHKDKAFRRRA